jgi:phosphoglycerate kinase
MDICTLDNVKVEGKKVLLRVDINSPLDPSTKKIIDETRIANVVPTIKELSDKKAMTIILAHQGRKGDNDFTSLEQHSKILSSYLGKKVNFIPDIFGERAKMGIKNLMPGEVLMLDNVRGWDGETAKVSPEEYSRSDLVKELSSLAQIYVNDAFAAAHRAQCSLVGFPEVMPSYAGRLLQKELEALSRITMNPEKPFVFLLGGAKFADVPTIVERLLLRGVVDKILLGGLPAQAFAKADGTRFGEASEKELEKEGDEEIYGKIKSIMKKYRDHIVLPLDFATEIKGKRIEYSVPSDHPTETIKDIGSRTVEEYKKYIKNAKTVFVSGPLGIFEKPGFEKGTEEVFRSIAESDAFSLIGGAHTTAAIKKFGFENRVSYISTGGGALEDFLVGKKLPGVEALKKAKERIGC